MIQSRKVVQILKQKFLGIEGIKPGDAMGYGEGSVFLGNCAEGGEINDFPACNYFGYADDPNETIWIMGVHRELVHETQVLGYHVECHDPGTYIAYPD